MRDFLKAVWRDYSVKIVAALAVAGAAAIAVVLRGWLSEDVSGPRWLFALPWLFVVIFAVVAMWLWTRQEASEPVRQKQETFVDGILWQWDLAEGRVENLKPLCPTPDCKTELTLTQFADHPFDPEPQHGTDVFCVKCNRQIVRLINVDEPQDQARRKLEAALRTGTLSQLNRGTTA